MLALVMRNLPRCCSCDPSAQSNTALISSLKSNYKRPFWKQETNSTVKDVLKLNTPVLFTQVLFSVHCLEYEAVLCVIINDGYHYMAGVEKYQIYRLILTFHPVTSAIQLLVHLFFSVQSGQTGCCSLDILHCWRGTKKIWHQPWKPPSLCTWFIHQYDQELMTEFHTRGPTTPEFFLWKLWGELNCLLTSDCIS